MNVRISQSAQDIPVSVSTNNCQCVKMSVDSVVALPPKTNHGDTTNRDEKDQHPIKAITDLGDTLDEINLALEGKLDDEDVQALTNMEIEALLRSFV